MSRNDTKKKNAAVLRRHAEELLLKTRTEISRMPLGKLESLVHELQVYLVELDMQNEELQRVQHDLEESRDKARTIYDFSPTGHLTLDERRIIREISLSAAAQLGANRGDLIGKSLALFIAAEDQDAFYHWRRRLVGTGHPKRCEVRIRRPDGKLFWARLEGTPVLGGDDEAPRVRVYLTDMTENRRLEEGWAEAKRLVGAVFGASPDPILVVGGDGFIIRQASDSLENIFGWKPGEVIGQTMDILIAEPHRRAHSEFLFRNRGAKAAARCESEAVRKDGSRFPAELSIGGLDAAAADQPHFIEVIRDLTERKPAG